MYDFVCNYVQNCTYNLYITTYKIVRSCIQNRTYRYACIKSCIVMYKKVHNPGMCTNKIHHISKKKKRNVFAHKIRPGLGKPAPEFRMPDCRFFILNGGTSRRTPRNICRSSSARWNCAPRAVCLRPIHTCACLRPRHFSDDPPPSPATPRHAPPHTHNPRREGWRGALVMCCVPLLHSHSFPCRRLWVRCTSSASASEMESYGRTGFV